LDLSKFGNLVNIVSVWDETGLLRIAVLANVNGSAFDSIVVTSSLIDRAGLVCDLIFVHEVEGT
jgi:hypothetical protein